MNPLSTLYNKIVGAGDVVSDGTAGIVGDVGAYSGGGDRYGFSDYGSGGSKWPNGLSASGGSRVIDHYTTRQNARDAMQDSPQARAIVERFADTVVDTGMRLECNPEFEILGIKPESAEQWARATELRFHAYASSKQAFRCQTMTLYQGMRMAQVFQQRDNDYFVRFFYSRDRDLMNPLQLQFVDPDQINGYGLTSTYGGAQQLNTHDGIEKNAAGREIAYHVTAWNGKEFKQVRIPAEYRGRTMMIHGFQPEYAGQHRGYSRLAHALQDFENITDFSMAHIKKAINQSNITMTVESESDSPASNPFEDLVRRRGAGPLASSVIGSNPSSAPAGETPQSFQEMLGYYEMPETTFTTPGSVGVFNLMGREKLKPFYNTTPSEHFDAFVNSFTGYLSASLSIPLEVVLMKFNQSYSASRGALLLFWRVANIWRMEMAADFLNPVYKAWLAEEIASGRIQAPGWQDPVLKSAWLSCMWNGSPMPNIDPSKTAQADENYVRMGAQTLDMVARNLNGSDGATNRAKLKREIGELPIQTFGGPSEEKPGKPEPKKPEEKEEDDG